MIGNQFRVTILQVLVPIPPSPILPHSPIAYFHKFPYSKLPTNVQIVTRTISPLKTINKTRPSVMEVSP